MPEYGVFQAYAHDGRAAVPAAMIEVKKEINGAIATIFSGRTGGALDNPFPAESDGYFRFYAPGGAYKVTAYKNGQVMLHPWRHVAIGLGAEGDFRSILSEDRTYYVRPDGDDDNTGFSDDVTGAFLTVQAAVDAVAALDINGKTVTIQIADGTYTGAVTLKNVPGFAAAGNLIIKGNNSTPANVVISTTTHCITADGISSVWSIRDLKLMNSSGQCMRAISGAIIRFQNLELGSAVGGHFSAQANGTIIADGNWAVSAGAPVHIGCSLGGKFRSESRTITFSNSPAFAVVFCSAAIGCGVARLDSMTFTNGGTVTGKRYDVSANSVIFTKGGGASYLPGDVAGTDATGGEYI